MKLDIEIRGRKRSVELVPQNDPDARATDAKQARLLCRLDGKPVEVDAVEVATGVYSIILSGEAFEVRVQPDEGGPEVLGRRLRVFAGGDEFSARVLDPRMWRGKRGGVLEAEGRQQITAPMPGKVVRLLAKAGDAVEAGQGLLVVEAMKMQNEIRSPKTGKVERMLVAEGQAVTSGETLAVVA